MSRLRQDGLDIVLRSGGYTLAAGETDLGRFRELCARARGSDSDDVKAEALLTEALALWRGDALTGLDSEWAQAERDRLHQERLAAEHDLFDTRLRMGQGEELLAGLSARAVAHPLDERLAGQYMLALSRAGRASDALAHYRQLRERLVDELGTDPGVALQELHQRVLNGELGRAGAEPVAVPRQLPAAPAPFVGRHDALDRLDATFQDTSATVLISAIAGAGGIGKTWLALHWAHQYADTFPDGHLFVDLRGFSPEGPPMPPAVALRGFLDALGVEPGRVPVDVHAQSAMFRSLVAGKRMLLVLDNAVDTSQVTPLLPGSGTCTVVVTSRNQLPGLITGHGARHVLLDVLPDAEARALLTRRLGAERVEAEPSVVASLVELCGGFPLALSVVAGHAYTRPHLALAELAAELNDLGLGALDSDDPTASLPTVLSWSHNALTEEQASAFALLGIAPGADIGLSAAADLVGLARGVTRAVLRGLEQASLLTEDASGRYRMHDLVRRYAVSSALHDLPEETRVSALRRVIDGYAHTAHAADRVIDPHRQQIQLEPPVFGVHPRSPATIPAALAWFDAEHANLLAAQQTAAAQGWHQAVWHLAWSLNIFHIRRGHLHDRLATWKSAVDAVIRLPDVDARILVHRCLGIAYADLGRHEEASRYLRQALAMAERHKDPTHQAHIHRVLARAFRLRGDEETSLKHATEALQLFRALGEPVWEADALNNIGMSASARGDHDIARDHCQAALELQRRHEDVDGKANTLDSLGAIEHNAGDHTRAVDYFRESITLYQALGNNYQLADTLDRIGHPHVALGRPDQARAAWLEALDLYRQLGRVEDADRVQRQLSRLRR